MNLKNYDISRLQLFFFAETINLVVLLEVKGGNVYSNYGIGLFFLFGYGRANVNPVLAQQAYVSDSNAIAEAK